MFGKALQAVIRVCHYTEKKQGQCSKNPWVTDSVLTMSKILGHNFVDSVAFHLTCKRAFMSNQRDNLEFSIDEVKVWTYYLSMSNILKRVLRNLVLWLTYWDFMLDESKWRTRQCNMQREFWKHQFNRHYFTYSVLNSISSDTEQFCENTYLFAPLFS